MNSDLPERTSTGSGKDIRCDRISDDSGGSSEKGRSFAKEGVYDPADKQQYNQDRKHELKKSYQLGTHLYSLTGVNFFKIVFDSPAVFRQAEEKENKRSCRQQDTAYNKILTVEDIAIPDNMNVLQNVISQNAGNASYEHDDAVYQHGFLSAPSEIINC